MLFDKFKKLMLNSDIHIEDRKKILCKIPLDNLKQIRNEILLKMDLNMGYNDFLLSLLEKRIEFLEVDVELIKSFNPEVKYTRINKWLNQFCK